MAEVYLAYDEFLGREVAFKVLDRKYAENRDAIERFRREAKNAASLRHPSIVATHDRGETENGTYYIVMEYMEGGTLEDLIQQEEGPLPPREAAEITAEIADALQVAHEGGVIHRDIKPQNILLSKTGQAKVADFGIARAASATTMTQAGSILGTVHYISPEQALGEPATPRSDLYSLGVVLYEMLTGELPHDAETPVGVVMKHVSGLTRSPRDANPDVPEELDAVVGRLLSRNPEDRYPDAATLVEDLERIADGLPAAEWTGGARSAGGRTGRSTRSGTSGRKLGTGAGAIRARPVSAPGGSRQRLGLMAAVALALVSIGVITIVALTQRSDPPAQAITVPTEGILTPGAYRSDEFEPALSFGLDDGWAAAAPKLPDNLTILEDMQDQPSALGFRRPQSVFDPEDPGGQTLLTAPESVNGWADWFREHPDLGTEAPVPVTIGGASGLQLDAVAEHSTPLVSFGDRSTEVWAKGVRGRVIVLEVEGETVQILLKSSSADRFEGFLPKAQEVLDTVSWGD